MLNFRKLRQDFSSAVLKEGKQLYEHDSVLDAKILHLDQDTIRLSSKVKGTFENIYESEVEINRSESCAVDSNCDCTYTYDCQHIAAFLFFLEKHLNQIVVDYSKQTDLKDVEEEVKEELQQTFQAAQAKEGRRQDEAFQSQIVSEYIGAAHFLGHSPFFLPHANLKEDEAELAVILVPQGEDKDYVEISLALRLPARSKPLAIPNIKAFLNAFSYREPIVISGRRYFFTPASFDLISREILPTFVTHVRAHGSADERYLRLGHLAKEELGALLARMYELNVAKGTGVGEDTAALPCFYLCNLEEPLSFSLIRAQIYLTLETLTVPSPTILLNPTLMIDQEPVIVEEALVLPASKPGVIYKNVYYRFQPQIRRIHLKELSGLSQVAIPEPLIGTFIEHSLPVLKQYASVTNPSEIQRFVTLPFAGEIKGRCQLHYLNGELEAELLFSYGDLCVPAVSNKLAYQQIAPFVGEEGILARQLVEEQAIIDALFEDFVCDEKDSIFRLKSEKKIVEFMTEVIPKFQDRIQFDCPQNLSEQFIYDDTTFTLHLDVSDRIDQYEVKLEVNGHLRGVLVDQLWECVASKKRFLELARPKQRGQGGIPKILVLDLDKLSPIVALFDEIGLTKLDTHIEQRPLWSLTMIRLQDIEQLPISFAMSSRLKNIQQQMLGELDVVQEPIPQSVQAELRKYQIDGVHWLQKLRHMHLGGILADDMGLGKTLQAIVALCQHHENCKEKPTLIVCPTSLVYNWQAEIHKFAPHLRVLVVDSNPQQRKRLLSTVAEHDVVISSYNLLQKDIELYKEKQFYYVILDEAQHIKNRGTRNAKSVKMIRGLHRLILTGTPIENSLDELWSLFDFLMPGLLSSYDRFVEKFIRKNKSQERKEDVLAILKRKVSPFILRRMKEDVLDDLPPVSEIEYHCHLSGAQKELYHSYAASAKEELTRLVKKEGFDRVQIHVLATLTRLKQICCHPAIFAKEQAEEGDSAKYDMLLELLTSLVESKHKTVIFSQYTKMLAIMQEDLKRLHIPFSYLDGSSKNRLEIVNQFNEDDQIPVFLVSLKAGGAGLNLVGADTVIHYDMWWNPAVENQATDRVHRLGQKRSVSSYKLITLNTIEEKIVNLQKRKRGLVKKIISSDDEAIAKLSWEEVLELLQT